MNKVLIIIFSTAVFFYVPFVGRAQVGQPDLPGKLSLQEAIQLGLKNNLDVRAAGIQTRMANDQTQTEQWKKIPEVYASFDLRRNLIIPTTPVPAIAFDHNAPPDEMLPLRFATKWSSSAGLNLNYDLFNPDKNGRIKEAQKNAEIQALEETITNDQLRYDVESDYVACVIAYKQLELAIRDTARQSKVLTIANDQYQAGRLKIAERNQIVSNQLQSISNFHEAEKIYNTARAQLLHDLGYLPDRVSDLSLADSLENILNQLDVLSSPNQENTDLQKIKLQQSLTHLQIKNKRQNALPVVSLKGFYGSNFYDNDFRFLRNQFWYGNSYIGLGIHLPITEGLSRMKDIQYLQSQQQLQQTQYRQKEQELSLLAFKNSEEVNYQQKELGQKEKDFHLKEENFRSAMDQFENGRLSTRDFLESEYQYQKAKMDYLQTLYSLILAKIELEKSQKL